MTTKTTPKGPAATPARGPRADARPGDWLETRGLHGEPARRGEILEVIGRPGHHRYRVRWDEVHESIVFPADGVHIRKRGQTLQSSRV